MAAGDANVSCRGTDVTVGGADVAAGDADVAAEAAVSKTAAVDSSAMLPRAATGGALSSLFFNFFSCFAFLHFPQVILTTRPTTAPFKRAHVLHSLKLGQHKNAKSKRSFFLLQVVHFTKSAVLAVEDPPSEDAIEQASAPW